MEYDVSLQRVLEVAIGLYREADTSCPYGMYKDFELVTYMGDITVGWACSKDVPQQKHKTNSGKKYREV
jgi:hypothetical protein